VERDTRIEEIDGFVGRLRAAVERRDDAGVRASSYALREMLNVNPESLALPSSGRDGFTGAFVGKLFNEWKGRQVQFYEEWQRGGGAGEPDWSALGVRNSDDVARILEALVNCLGPETYAAIAVLARRLVEAIPGSEEHSQQHLRRYLAMEMTNRLVFKPIKRKPGAAARRRGPAAPSNLPEPRGTDTAAYSAFIGPFVEIQLAEIKDDLTPVVLRPPLHGDDALDSILDSAP
jgi:hypothetical protein